MMKKFYDLADLCPWIIYFGNMAGFLLPNTKDHLKGSQIKRKILYFFIRYSHVPVIVLNVFSVVDNSYSTVKFMNSKNMSFLTSVIVKTITNVTHLFRIGVFWMNPQEVKETCALMAGFLKDQSEEQGKSRQLLMKRLLKIRNITSLITITYTFVLLANSIPYLAYGSYKAGKAVMLIGLPMPPFLQYFYQFTFVSTYLIGTALFHGLLMLYYTLGMSQMDFLKEKLLELYSIIKVEESGEVNVDRTQLGLFSVRPGYPLAKEELEMLEKKCDTWIIKHNDALRFGYLTKNMFRVVVQLGYFQSMINLIILIFLLQNTKEKHPLSYSTFSVLQMIMLFGDCFVGDGLAETSGNVCDEAYGTNWFAYPLTMQKKLIYIMHVSRSRPCTTHYKGIFPLDLPVYNQVCTAACNLFMFALTVLSDDD